MRFAPTLRGLVCVTVLFIVLILPIMMLAGCSPPTTDYDGRKMTQEQIDAALNTKLAAAQKKLEADAKAAAEEVRSAQAAQQIAAAKVQRDYALKLQKLSKNAEIDAAAVSNELADTLASSNERLAGRLAEIVTTHDDTQSKIAQAADDAKKMADIAQADIQRQIEQRGVLLQLANAVTQAPVVKQALDASGFGTLVTTGLGALATGWAVRARGSQARHDAVWDEAFAAGKKASDDKHETANAAFDEATARAAGGNTINAVAALIPQVIAAAKSQPVAATST